MDARVKPGHDDSGLMTSTDIAPSIAEHVRPVAAGATVVATHFLGRSAAFVLGEETVLLVSPEGAERRVKVHDGGILAAAGDDADLITAGDDGRVVATDASGNTRLIAADAMRRWIDHVAVGPDGAVAWSAGKTVFVQTRSGEQKSLELPSAAGGLAFTPKGFRLAIAHYNGATLWFPNAAAVPERLEWKGSHLAIAFSPDGKFLVTAMQEPMLHGWRLADRKHMRMSGYSTKVRSLDWTADGKWLATAGSEQLVLWPFQGKDGPMGKTPRMLSPREVRVVAVACHPAQEVAAVGYADGMMLLVRLADGAEILVRKPAGAPLSALGWSKGGETLAFGTEDGEAGLLAV
jgi:WD40 repeat protein